MVRPLDPPLLPSTQFCKRQWSLPRSPLFSWDLSNLGYQKSTWTCAYEIYEDNLACVAVSENPVRLQILAPCEIRCAANSRATSTYFVRKLVKADFIKRMHLRTHTVVADALSKTVPSPMFNAYKCLMTRRTTFAFKFSKLHVLLFWFQFNRGTLLHDGKRRVLQ